jgi:hypothetical protein
VYADIGSLPSLETAGFRSGRARVERPPFHGLGVPAPRAEEPHGPGWVDLPDTLQPLDQGPALPAGNLQGTAHQGAPSELRRPVRQKPGRRSRRMVLPGGSGDGASRP